MELSSDLAILGLAVGGAVLGLGLFVILPAILHNSPQARANRRAKAAVTAIRFPGLGSVAATDAALAFAARDRRLVQKLKDWIAHQADHIGGPRSLFILIGVAVAMASAMAFGLGRLNVLSGGWLVLTSMASGIGVAFIGYGQMRRRWQIAFLDHLADAIDLMIRAVRSGIPVAEAIRVAGREVNDPVRTEFHRVSDGLDLGLDLRDAMSQVAARIRIPDFDFLVVALSIQRETGGQLADTLDNLSAILRKRKELRLKSRAMTAEGRMSATVVAILPFAVGGLMYYLNPEYTGKLFEPGTGQEMVLIGVGLLTLGIVVIHQMTRERP